MNILFLDIEATDLNADIGHLLCIGYKWAHEKQAKVMSIKDYPGKYYGDDSKLLKAFESIQSKADLIIHHFGDYYDLPFLRTRRLIHKMKALPEAASVDTWRIARKRLKFGSNRLERILSVLGCPFKKTALDIGVWAKARQPNSPALTYIVRHCKADVLVLEWVYNRLRGLWPSHPNLYLIGNRGNHPHCKVCKEGKYKSNGYRVAQGKRYIRLYCDHCGHSDKGKTA